MPEGLNERDCGITKAFRINSALRVIGTCDGGRLSMSPVVFFIVNICLWRIAAYGAANVALFSHKCDCSAFAFHALAVLRLFVIITTQPKIWTNFSVEKDTL